MQRISQAAFLGQGPFQGTGASIPVWNVSREQIDKDRAAILRNLMNPPGTAVSYPYIVKIAGEGEYVVKSDGTAQFYSYKYGRWEPPVLIDNQTIWAKATGQDGDKDRFSIMGQAATVPASQAPSAMIKLVDSAAIAQSVVEERNKTYLTLAAIALVGAGAGYLLWKKMK